MVEPTRAWPRTGTLRERWPEIPTDRDEAERFATEYAIALRAELISRAGQTEISVEVELETRNRMGSPPPLAAGMHVELGRPELRWEMTLPAGHEYEDPAALAERFRDESRRIVEGRPR